MSADNYIGVYYDKLDEAWKVMHGFASSDESDCQYKGSLLSAHQTRPEALVAAHDEYAKMDVVEYGVIECSEWPRNFCGRCYACIEDRRIVSPDVQNCTACGKPFIAGTWRVLRHDGEFHSTCAPDFYPKVGENERTQE